MCGQSSAVQSGLQFVGGGTPPPFLFFLATGRDFMTLKAFLEAEGYRRIPLQRNGVGHFEAAGSLASRSIRVLVDTGAASTVVSLSLARELGLNVASLGRMGGGAGGVQLEIFKLHDTALELDGLKPRPVALYAMDLSHVNAALVLKGAAPVEAILGVDVFDRQKAVIDYDSSSLFLKDI
jgi:predicted aspartyl protease